MPRGGDGNEWHNSTTQMRLSLKCHDAALTDASYKKVNTYSPEILKDYYETIFGTEAAQDKPPIIKMSPSSALPITKPCRSLLLRTLCGACSRGWQRHGLGLAATCQPDALICWRMQRPQLS
jgi:hypothetical protein